jgi:uncharacterized repeat protein (TIGR03803 family)
MTNVSKLICVTLFLAAASVISPAQITFATLVSFDGTNGETPTRENLIQGKDGNLYGTTNYGGTSNFGTIFKVTPMGKLTTLHSFNGARTATPPIQGSYWALTGISTEPLT